MTAIQVYRERAGLTQEMLAEKLGVTQPAVSNWESGDRKPDIFMLKKISTILNCTTDELLAIHNKESGKEDTK
jgi:transcriptional regulator with XRE-family HTH domain